MNSEILPDYSIEDIWNIGSLNIIQTQRGIPANTNIVLTKEGKKIDMHCHTIGSDGINTVEQLIAEAKRKGLEALFVTDHDRVSFDSISKLRQAGLISVPSVEISTVNTKGDNKGLHMTYYSDAFSEELLGILDTTCEKRQENLIAQIYFLREQGFFIDEESFFSELTMQMITNYNLARYICAQDENKDILISLGIDMSEMKPHSQFYKKFLKRGGKLFHEKDLQYKSELGHISELTQGRGVLSIAHPNYTFSGDRIRGFLQLYREVYLPKLGISAIEINTLASKKWVEAILSLKDEYPEIQLTFGSDCHRLGKPDDTHGDLGFENFFLDDVVVKREFLNFRDRLGI